MHHRSFRAPVLSFIALLALACAGGGGTQRPPTPGTGGSGDDPDPTPQPPRPDAASAKPADAALPPPDTAATAPTPDAAVAVDVAAPDVASSSSPDGPPATGTGDGGYPIVPVGTRVSIEPMVSARWIGTRRTVSMEGTSKVFTAGFEAGKFGAGGNGHLIRLAIDPGSEYVFEYRLKFEPGWDFSRGGKIPGLAGGNAPSGCQQSTDVGFTARQMWRENGRLIGYIYDMDQASACGNALATGFNFAVGRWYSVKQRIKLNTGSARNGILQLSIDDRMVINRSNMGWMIEAPNRHIDRIFLDFFFGGSTADWSPSRNCSLSFSDLYLTKLAD